MPDKTDVLVANIGVVSSFDKKYKSTLPKVIKTTTETEVKAILEDLLSKVIPAVEKNAP